LCTNASKVNGEWHAKIYPVERSFRGSVKKANSTILTAQVTGGESRQLRLANIYEFAATSICI
jgi:hypothetical protein